MSRLEFEWIRDAQPSFARPPGEPHGSISACLVVRNQEDVIARCLDSLRGVADEIVVVHDGPPSDRTLEIAAGRGCRVIEAPYYGHCERHTPLAYETARGEWLLNLDADEFLSPELAAAIRSLVAVPDADGYEFLWKHWDGRRYVTERGPYKLVLFRRQATRMIGLIHMPEQVDGTVRRVPLHLEHRPPGNHRQPGAMLAKWRARARLQAREYLAGPDEVPRFNYPGAVRWTTRRELATRLAPVLVVPAAVHTFFFVLSKLWRELGAREALRFASSEAAYRGMVTAYLAWYRLAGVPSATSPPATPGARG